MASELNIAGLQKKVDQSVSAPPVFASPSSAQQNAPENPDAGQPPPSEADKPAQGDNNGEGAIAQPTPSKELILPEKN